LLPSTLKSASAVITPQRGHGFGQLGIRSCQGENGGIFPDCEGVRRLKVFETHPAPGALFSKGLRKGGGEYAEGVKLDAEVWFRFDSESVSTVGTDVQRLKKAAERAGFELRGAKITPATPGEGKRGWSERTPDGWTSYVPLDSEPNQ
jgi:hypothetical protein